MEPDLDRLLDFEERGTLFPQFGDVWKARYQKALDVRDKLLAQRPEVAMRFRVALQIVEPLSFVSAFLAFCRSPVDLFFFNPTWSREEFSDAWKRVQPHCVIRDYRGVQFDYEFSDLAQAAGPQERMGEKTRFMIPTGGTSGAVKFAIHDWSTIAASVYGFERHMECERMGAHCILPLYHVSGFMQLVRALLTMGSVVFGRLEDFRENHTLLFANGSRDRFLSLVSTQLERILREDTLLKLLPEYRAIFVGGGPTPIGLLERCRELKIPLAPTYGMTETAAQVATQRTASFLKGDFRQGKPLPHVAIDIVDERDKASVLPRCERGLVRIRCSSLFKGYWGEPHKPGVNSIVTSDIGLIEADGILQVLGRADRVVISGGEKIHLRDVELAFERTGLVKDVICFGVSDSEWGEKLAVAYVPMDAVVSEEALRQATRDSLAGHRIPKLWIRKDVLPRNEAGKIQTRELLPKGSRV